MKLNDVILFADFETNTDCVSITSSNVNLWCLIDGDKKMVGVDMESFMNQIFQYEKATIYFHNLSFDGQFILPWLLNNGFEINNKYQKPTTKHSFSILADKKTFYQILIKNNNSKISIICSYRLFSIQVADLGEILNMPKGDGSKWFDSFALIKDRKIKYKKLKNNKFNEKGEEINYYSNLKQFHNILKKQGFHTDGNFEYNENCDCYQCYCIKDAIIVREYYQIFTKRLKPSLTISSTAKKTMSNFLIKSDKLDNNFLKLKTIYLTIFGKGIMKISSWKKFQSSYYGGYVSYNHEKPVLSEGIDGYSADVNSMYPAVMTQKIAIGELRDTNEYYLKNKLSYEKLLGVVVSKIDIKPGKPAIWPSTSKITGILRQDNKYKQAPFNERRIYHWEGSAFFMFWEKEWEYIKECYDFVGDITYTGFVQTTDALKYYINKYYNLKTDAKNVSERSVYKLLLNSTYGKLGEKIERDEHIYFDFSKDFDWEKLKQTKNYDKIIAIRTADLLKRLRKLYKTDIKKYYKEIDKRRDLHWYNNDRTITKILIHCKIKEKVNGYEIKKLSSIVSASYITMLARLELYKVIIPNFDNWLYCDTDSAYFTKKPTLQIDNKKLGFWKWEKRFNKMKILRPKVYSVEQTHKWNGEKWVEDYQPFGSQKTTAISGHKIDKEQVITEKNFERGILNPRLQNQAKLVRGGVLIRRVKKKL